MRNPWMTLHNGRRSKIMAPLFFRFNKKVKIHESRFTTQ